MPNNTMAANLIATRGNRLNAVLLGWLEEHVYELLPEELQKETRRMILDEVNAFKDLAMDIIKSDTAYYNEIWVEKLDQIHEAVRRGR